MYICTYSVPQSASSISLPLHRPRKEKGHAKAGLTLPPECSTAPCQPSLWPPVCPQPQRPGGPAGGTQELGLPYFDHRIQFLFCIVFLWPLWESRAREKDRFMQLFSYIPCSEWGRGSPPVP